MGKEHVKIIGSSSFNISNNFKQVIEQRRYVGADHAHDSGGKKSKNLALAKVIPFAKSMGL